MKKIVRLTESDLTRLVKRIIKEQREMEDPFENYIRVIDIIARHAREDKEEFDLVEQFINEIHKIIREVEIDERLSEEEADEIIDHASWVIKELEHMFEE